MTVHELRTKRIGILGFDRNNRGVTEWLVRHEIGTVSVLDEGAIEWRPGQSMNGVPQTDPTLRVHEWRLGADAFARLTDFDLLIRTPGVRPNRPELEAARAAGVVITSQTQLFFDLSPATVIGVTGTKGKGTTASLIAAMLQADPAQQGSCYLAGNIGLDPFTFLDRLTPQDSVVLELSSFQLIDLHTSPHIAVVLGITSEHLDYHASLAEYVAAKTALVKFQSVSDFVVLNSDSPTTGSFAQLSRGQVWEASRIHPVDQGTFVRWTDVAQTAGDMILRTQDGDETLIISIADLKLRGKHNLENSTAAVAAAYLAGASLEAIRTALHDFAGYEHRLQLIGEVGGVACYDDSAATSPEPALAAVRSFTEPVHLIVGGATKHADFTELGQIIAQDSSVVTVTPLGNAEAIKIVAAIEVARQKTLPVILPETQTMDAAVRQALGQAKAGEVLLLSPAATGFDLFKNYVERGEQFSAAVHRLAKETHGA